ncbi:netrin receptor UNC5A-like [Ptychodera flava]|uniref:netrin receptor UNC5A-like n=1 Tax=Ptychodera flava TaxID=63121 RepID=UPI00396A5D0D
MLGRRLLIVVCHVFIHNEFIRTVVLVSCCSAFLFHHVFAKPYITGFLNHAETAFLLLLITIGLINTVDAFCYSYGATACKPGQHILKDMCILSCVLALVPLMIPLIALLRRCVHKSLRRLPCCKEFTKLKLHSEDQSSTTSDVHALLSEDIDEESEDRQRSRTASQSINTPGTNGPRRPRIYSHTVLDNGPSSLLADVTTFGADCTDGGSILQEPLMLPPSPESNGSEPNRVNVNVPEREKGRTTKSGAGTDKEDAAATNDRLLRRMREENVYLKACLQQLAKILSAANDPEILSSTNFTTTVFAAGVFNYEGGHLTIEQAGVNLFIPPGALSEDDGHQQFYVYVSTIDSEYPRLADNQTALSPVIRLGPPGFRFQKHVLLSVKNCIDSKQPGSLKLFGSHTDIDELVDWYDTSERQQTLCIAQGEDAISFIHQLSMYCVISDVTSCNYNVHIFMTAINNTYTRIRVRISRDTPADVELVKMKEQAGDNYQYKDQRMVVLHKTDGDYKIELTEVSPKTWNLVDGESVKIISKESLWMNNQGGGPCPGVTYLLERGHQQGFRQISGAIELKKMGNKTPICTLAFKDDLASP